MSERIRLDEDDFNHLLRGGEIETESNTKIILADIGYLQMLKLIQQAQQDGDQKLGLTKRK